MIDPQENITIGNVLYALGLCIGVRAGVNAPVAAINLLQQTSYDGPLADVMLAFSSMTRLLEFKRRRQRNSTKERAKHRLLANAMADLPNEIATSRQIHWYVETANGPGEFIFAARPYLDMMDEVTAPLDLKSFINALVDEALAPNPQISSARANEYIRDLAIPWGTGGTHSSTGLLVTVSGSGELMYAVLDDLSDLQDSGQQCLKLQMARQVELQQTLNLQRTHANIDLAPGVRIP